MFFSIVVNSVTFISLRTYAGIIRYSSIQDSFRIMLAVVTGIICCYLINFLYTASRDYVYISNTILLLTGFFSLVFLVTYRSAVKYFFVYVRNAGPSGKKVIIFGAGGMGIATKRTLDHDDSADMMPVAFVDDDLRKSGKYIEGVRIHHASALGFLTQDNDVSHLIIAAAKITPERKNQIVDFCLVKDIQVLVIPPVESWRNGQISTKQIQTIRIEDLLEREAIEIHNDEIGQQLTKKSILVTGAAGSIGSEIVRQLAKFSPSLIVLADCAESALHELQLEMADSRIPCKIFIGDVRDEQRMERLFDIYRPHYVYHAAAYKHVPLMEDNPSEAIRTNVMGTRIIADLSVKYSVGKFVMVSTDKAVNPTSIMGASKRIAEIYVQSLFSGLNRNSPGTQFITTRFGNVLGSNGSVIPRFKAQIEKGGPVTVTHPDITRYFMTIPEACRLVLEAGSMGEGGEIFIFDMGESVKIVELARKMIRLSGLIPDQDIAIQFTGLRPGEKLYEELLNDQENTFPTHHQKIMAAKVRKYDFVSASQSIDELIRLANQHNEKDVVIKMKKIVPEFKSNNSVYEELDRPEGASEFKQNK